MFNSKSIVFLVMFLVTIKHGLSMELSDTLVMPKVPFIFVRHGQTPWGPEAIKLGPQDLELNPEGRLQAMQAGQFLAKTLKKPPIIISSPLKRAIQTAEIIKEYTRSEQLVAFEDLRERYYGDYRLICNFVECPPDGNYRLVCDMCPPDIESLDSFNQRVIKSFTGILTEYQTLNHELIIVSHQKVFEMLTTVLIGSPYKLDQGGVACFTPDDTSHWQLNIPSLIK